MRGSVYLRSAAFAAMRYSFGPFELDDVRYELARAGVPVPLQPRVFDFLIHIVRRSGHVCTHRELIEHVWGGTKVSSDAVAHAARCLRRALESPSAAPDAYVETVRGRGYRFRAPVKTCPGELPSGPHTPGGREAIAAALEHLRRALVLLSHGEPRASDAEDARQTIGLRSRSASGS